MLSEINYCFDSIVRFKVFWSLVRSIGIGSLAYDVPFYSTDVGPDMYTKSELFV